MNYVIYNPKHNCLFKASCIKEGNKYRFYSSAPFENNFAMFNNAEVASLQMGKDDVLVPLYKGKFTKVFKNDLAKGLGGGYVKV